MNKTTTFFQLVRFIASQYNIYFFLIKDDTIELYNNESPFRSPVFSGVRVTRSLVLCICFVDRCFVSFCTFSFGKGSY